ncbi:MAG: D-alanyl-D-alanine carboxypeptidase/D-alanyl-D-alanine-endopeptidase [Candidatus Kapabacteria bacterium]|nr:D-alanyl-D-alanine carboxypeptidase/D-alanyl-D-alanine-endopeptidase [Candidatus Kapabacteria bacterium]
MKKILFLSVIILSFAIYQPICTQHQTKGSGFNYPSITASDSAKSILTLQNDIQKILGASGLKTLRYGISIYSVDSKKYFFEKNSDMLLTPASVSKLFTAATALHYLGSDYKLKTELYIDGSVQNNILIGDIYLVGYGNPFFYSSHLDSMAQTIKDLGVKEIRGNIYADGSFFDELTERLDYSGDKDIVQALQPITALIINNNILKVTVTAGNRAGQLVWVQTDPPSDGFSYNVTAKVHGFIREERKIPTPRQRGNNLEPENQQKSKSPKNEIIAGDSPSDIAQRRQSSDTKEGISVNTKLQNDGTQLITVTGRLDAGKSYTYFDFIRKPDLVAAGSLKNKIEKLGITIIGALSQKSVKSVNNKSNLRVVYEVTNNITDLIVPMVKNSDNFQAEVLFKIIGAKSGKLRDNAKETRRLIENLFENFGINCKECVLYDGSGLSRRSKITADAVTRLLEKTYNTNYGKVIDSSLAIASVDGTIRNRFFGTLAENNLHGKTGTHSNVSALAGYVLTLDGERLAYSMIFNGGDISTFKKIENEIGAVLAQFFYFNRIN